MRPGDTVVHKGRFWYVRKTEIRGDSEGNLCRWAVIIVPGPRGSEPIDIKRVPWEECETMEEGKDENKG